MTTQCKVKSIEPLASNTYKIILQPESVLAFKAGQYLMVEMGEKDKRPFSIASSPCRSGELELHIGAAEHNAYAQEVVEKMRTALSNNGLVNIDAPHGDAWVKENERPLLLIAGGTGFSYVRSILDHCISQKKSNAIYLYWGAKDVYQLYAKTELSEIAQQFENIHFVPVVETADEGWNGKVGNVLQAINDDFESLEAYDIYIAGRFDMAGVAREQFTQYKNAKSDHMFADAYAFI
ncbi:MULTISPECIES: NAD(P)H-flavin reductase [unclassified Vibrio]|uniref:NAD(P)H-flavin reductase n=1 Tax=unclassified Vibrio TaxID=2614977 RepID=UPI000B8EB792|nr:MULTISPECIES: NAD(P)H-flavin reductase [unclassified Vibrio]NAW90473.1 NAD(P)H-flavin reductase [Vibrio sp. V24_P1S3T111]OXX19731.1 NAD(P)H-flavin reductase [Vibrio sp. V05_P4A8T149]OXX22136.1 NAD(P)H-flavin reductase [Vibrio sp. V06_P1A73T115]OXX28429.1 NAD(P)H-flavin reductase [Vibrio sp. V14_P6S14T42]OXX36718.1 NAD(P)H-flavin reductase [Vibrio sp. V04_P4A5T148]